MALKFPRGWLWRPRPDKTNPPGFTPATILLASEGGRISTAAVEFAARLSREFNAPVLVLMIARIWGSAFGLPHPSLMPTKSEWQAQRDLATEAVDELRRLGVEATGKVVSSRNAARRIIAEARRHRPDDAIVMAAPPPRHWLIANFFWEQEPYRVRRLARSPVYLIVEGQSAMLDKPPSAAAGGADRLAFARQLSQK